LLPTVCVACAVLRVVVVQSADAIIHKHSPPTAHTPVPHVSHPPRPSSLYSSLHACTLVAPCLVPGRSAASKLTRLRSRGLP
jgi:hypothetical protein